MYMWHDNSVTPNAGIVAPNEFYINASYTTLGGSVRAPIFYDLDNTNYYGDFASTSRMNAISLNTIAVTSGITGLTSAPLSTQYANAGTTNTWYPMTYQEAQYNSGYVTHLNTGLYKQVSGWGSANTGWYAAIGGSDSYPTQAWYLTYDAYIQNSLGYVLTSGSFRAPIFYDLDNTGYYVDPNGTSNISSLTINGSLSYPYAVVGTGGGAWGHRTTGWSGSDSTQGGPSGFYDGYAMSNMPTSDWYHLIINAHNNSYSGNQYEFHIATAFWDKSLFWMRSISPGSVGAWRKLLWDGISGVTVNTLYSNIIYDSDNTGYYVDPASTSTMYGVSATNFYMGNALYLAGNNYYINNNGNWFGTNVSFRTTVNFQGPIYYDSDNTSYYIDANNTSRVYLLESDQGFQYTAYNSGRNRIWSFTNADGYGMAYFQGTGGYNGNADMIGMHFGTASVAGCQFTFVSSGAFIASNNITAYSDLRLKENIEVIPNALEKVKQIRGVTYTRNDTEDKDTRYAGVIAQEVMKVLPEVIMGSEETQYSVAYGNMVGLLIEAIKELNSKVAYLEEKLNGKSE